MGAYLRDHPPRRPQYRSPRRARPSGVAVVHTAESVMDTVGPDTGAESVAAFMVGRADPGSYHDLVDSDSVVHLVDYGDEAYQDGTGSNPHALSISFALRAADWPRLDPVRRAGFLRMGAVAFALQQQWLAAHSYPLTPLARITKAQSEARTPGFISHGDRDPGRRSDPGAHFPWAEFFTACLAAVGGTPPLEDDMYDQRARDEVVGALSEITGLSRATQVAAGQMQVALQDPQSGLVARVGALEGQLQVLASAGGVDAATLEAAAERGAAQALERLAIVVKDDA